MWYAQGMLVHVLASLSASAGAVLAYALLLVLQPCPWWDAPYVIAILAFLLGHALSAVSAGLSSVVQELTLGAPPVCHALGSAACHASGIVLRKYIHARGPSQDLYLSSLTTLHA